MGSVSQSLTDFDSPQVTVWIPIPNAFNSPSMSVPTLQAKGGFMILTMVTDESLALDRGGIVSNSVDLSRFKKRFFCIFNEWSFWRVERILLNSEWR
jgi:hypothetical protein